MSTENIEKNNNFDKILPGTSIILTLASITSSIFMFSKINSDGTVNEDNKKFLTPLISINLVIFVLFTIYLTYKYIKEEIKSVYKIIYIITGLMLIAGIILSLIYVAQRDKPDFVDKNFAKYTVLYDIFLLHIILIGIAIKKYECKNTE